MLLRALIDVLILLLLAALFLVVTIHVVLQNLPEVFNADLAILVFIGNLIENFLFVRLNGSELQLLKNVSESIHSKESSLIDIKQVEGLLDRVKLLNHRIREELVKLSGRHFLLAVQQKVDLAFLDLWLSDLPGGLTRLALDWEGGQVLAQVPFCHLLSLTVRDSIHEVADLVQSNLLVTSHHGSTI